MALFLPFTHVSYLFEHEVSILVMVGFNIEYVAIKILNGKYGLLVLNLIFIHQFQNPNRLIHLVVFWNVQIIFCCGWKTHTN